MIQYIIKNIVVGLFLCCVTLVKAQVGIGTTTPHQSAVLDVSGTNKGILIPRVNIADLNTIAPLNDTDAVVPESVLVYNENTSTGVGFYFWSARLNRWLKIIDEQDSIYATTPWLRISNQSTSTTNTQDSFITGKVSIGGNYDLGFFDIMSKSSEVPKWHFSYFTQGINDGMDLDLCRTRLSGSTFNLPLNNDVLGRLQFKGVNNVSGTTPNFGTLAKIEGIVDGNPSISLFGGSLPSRMELSTTEVNNTTPTKALIIHNDGKLQFPKHDNWRKVTTGFNQFGGSRIVHIRNNALAKGRHDRYRTMPITIKKTVNGNLEIVDDNGNSIELIPLKEAQDAKKNRDNNLTVVGNIKDLKSKKQDALCTVIKNADELTPLLLKEIPLCNSNKEAKSKGLTKGMVYKNDKNELMIVY